MRGDPAADGRPDLRWSGEVDLGRLAEWMDDAGLGVGPITQLTPLTGGTQNVLVRFVRDGRGYVFRGPPPHLRTNSNQTMLREARVLAALAGGPVPHPGFIAACDDPSVLGAAFFLMEPVDGFNAREATAEPHRSRPEMRHAMGLSLVDGLAALATTDHVAAGLGDFGKGGDFLERQTNRWRAQLESYAEFEGWPGPASIPGVERVARWLEDNRPRTSASGILHGDYHFGNVLFRHDRPALAAIVDWELATIGDPMMDLGHLLSTWPEDGEPLPEVTPVAPWDGFPTRSEIIARYGERTGRDMADIDWFQILASYRLGIILEGTWARACAGKAPREVGQRLHASTLNLFARANAKIDAA